MRRQALLLVDLALVAVATLFALVLRDNFEVSSQRLQGLLPYLATTLAAAAILLLLSGVNRTFWRFSAMADYLRVIAIIVAIVPAAAASCFLIDQLDAVPRTLPVIQGLLMAFLLVGARVGIRLQHNRRRQLNLPAPVIGVGGEEAVLVVGLNPITELFLRSVAEFTSEHMKIAGIVGRSERHSGRRLHQYRILGVPEEIESILKTLEVHGISINRIVVTMAFGDLSPVAQQALLDIEKKSDIRIDFFAERIGLDDTARRASPCEQTAASGDVNEGFEFNCAELQALARRPYLKAKRAIDFAVAAFVAVIGLPIIVIVSLVVAFDVGLPIIFWQQRPGISGRPFRLYKFRTMRSAHDPYGARIPDEERLSTIGRFLRRTRLDELPQLYNILAGEMSFVGPRPLLPVDQSMAFAARLLVRPGLTGWAQIAGGRHFSPRDKAILDIWYVRNASLRLDLRVIARTLPMIVFGERPDRRALRQAWRELERSKVREAPGAAKLTLPATAGNGRGARQHAA